MSSEHGDRYWRTENEPSRGKFMISTKFGNGQPIKGEVAALHLESCLDGYVLAQLLASETEIAVFRKEADGPCIFQAKRGVLEVTSMEMWLVDMTTTDPNPRHKTVPEPRYYEPHHISACGNNDSWERAEINGTIRGEEVLIKISFTPSA